MESLCGRPFSRRGFLNIALVVASMPRACCKLTVPHSSFGSLGHVLYTLRGAFADPRLPQRSRHASLESLATDAALDGCHHRHSCGHLPRCLRNLLLL